MLRERGKGAREGGGEGGGGGAVVTCIYICKNMYVKLYEVYIWILVLGSRGKCKRAIHVNKI